MKSQRIIKCLVAVCFFSMWNDYGYSSSGYTPSVNLYGQTLESNNLVSSSSLSQYSASDQSTITDDVSRMFNAMPDILALTLGADSNLGTTDQAVQSIFAYVQPSATTMTYLQGKENNVLSDVQSQINSAVDTLGGADSTVKTIASDLTDFSSTIINIFTALSRGDTSQGVKLVEQAQTTYGDNTGIKTLIQVAAKEVKNSSLTDVVSVISSAASGTYSVQVSTMLPTADISQTVIDAFGIVDLSQLNIILIPQTDFVSLLTAVANNTILTSDQETTLKLALENNPRSPIVMRVSALALQRGLVTDQTAQDSVSTSYQFLKYMKDLPPQNTLISVAKSLTSMGLSDQEVFNTISASNNRSWVLSMMQSLVLT